MVKITLENGTVLEGSVEELRQMGVKLPQQVKPLEVGDYAKVTQEFHRQNGTIVKLKAYERPGSSFPFRSVNLDGSEGDIFNRSGLTRATDEEVAEAKRQLEERRKKDAEKAVADKWAKIGRKPNEFKKGDIVKVVSNDGYNGVSGELEDYKPEHSYSFGIRAFNGEYHAPRNETVELITPVEHRFDKFGGDSE